MKNLNLAIKALGAAKVAYEKADNEYMINFNQACDSVEALGLSDDHLDAHLPAGSGALHDAKYAAANNMFAAYDLVEEAQEDAGILNGLVW